MSRVWLMKMRMKEREMKLREKLKRIYVCTDKSNTYACALAQVRNHW